MNAKASAISIDNLTYAFRQGQPVLSNLSLNVPQGSIYGFLGPNGAGKTTTMRLLTGLLPQQGEHIRFFGQSLSTQLPALFHKVGALIETPSLYLHLSGLDNLRVVARLRGISEKLAMPALEWVRLEKAAHKKASQYSLGMKQRLAIAMALLSGPELLMLDEPVNGLDPAGMVEMRELMKELNREKGITIFISSHLLHEVEKMCSHIAIIHLGSVRFEGTMQQLSAQAASEKSLTITVDEAVQWLEKVRENHPMAALVQPDKIQLTVSSRDEATAINRQLVHAGAPVCELRLHDGLEEWFMELTGKKSNITQ
jgi:lantibiotic transport system ATP-binding protein